MMMGRSVIAPFVLTCYVVDNIYDGKEHIVDFCCYSCINIIVAVNE